MLLLVKGHHKVVVASEGIKVSCTPNPGIDPRPEGMPSHSLDVKNPHESAVILIKGRPDDGEEEVYRLFQVKGDELHEMQKLASWLFSSADGSLTCQQLPHQLTGYRVQPHEWGYCRILEREWGVGEHLKAAMITAWTAGLSIPEQVEPELWPEIWRRAQITITYKHQVM